MKVFLLLGSLLAVVVAQEPSLSCRYVSYLTDRYSCVLTINNPNGFNNFTEIGGTHLEGFNDEDVNEVYSGLGVSKNIPQIICDTFPNLLEFDIFDSFVEEIDDNTFGGCSRIQYLYLGYNRISSISENAFSNLRDVLFINLDSNWLTTLPENVFANQQNLIQLDLSRNSLDVIPANLFQPLANLQFIFFDETNLTAINGQWFSSNVNLIHMSLGNNRITSLTRDSFVGLQNLVVLSLMGNGLTEIPDGVFEELRNLGSLNLDNNNFRTLRANAFLNLGQLRYLGINGNSIETIEAGAFNGLQNLGVLSLNNCGFRELDSNVFEGLSNLVNLYLNFNSLEELPPGLFASMPNLEYIGLWANRLKVLRRNAFGDLTRLRTLDLDGNIVNALDIEIVNDAVNLNTLWFDGNICASSYFGNFLISRATHLIALQRCFNNMRLIVDTTTENDGVYRFFDGPQPGIIFRVRSDNEVQIALTPFSFIWTPSIEIFLGSANNTRSVIRFNEDTDVVTIPTPNIIQQNRWNDFRITWANHNVLVFRGNEEFPFMSYTLPIFFPINFYGLRAVETQAAWSIQPLAFASSTPPSTAAVQADKTMDYDVINKAVRSHENYGRRSNIQL